MSCLKKEKVELELKVAELEDFRDALENSNTTFLKHIENLESQNEKSISEISELREECEAFKNDYNATTKKLDTAEHKMKDLTEDFCSSQQHISELQKTVAGLNSSCADSEKVGSKNCDGIYLDFSS